MRGSDCCPRENGDAPFDRLCKALVRSGGLLGTWRAFHCTQHFVCGSHARRITDVYSFGKAAITGARIGICCTHFRVMAWRTQMVLFAPSGMLRFDQIRRGRHFSCGHGHPVNLALPAGLRGRGLPPVMAVVLRAGCDESRLSGSTEAHRSNPLTGRQRVIPVFYPMQSARERGRR